MSASSLVNYLSKVANSTVSIFSSRLSTRNEVGGALTSSGGELAVGFAAFLQN